MKHFIYFYLHLPLLLISAATSTDQKTCTSPADIEEICKAVTAGKPQNEHDFCVSKLREDTRTKSVDAHSLAVVATRLSVAHATSTEAKIGELIDLENQDPADDERLSVCMDAYSDAVDALQDALDNLNAKLYSKSMALLRSALEAARKCEEAFKDGDSGASPLTVDDGDFARLASIAHGITESLE